MARRNPLRLSAQEQAEILELLDRGYSLKDVQGYFPHLPREHIEQLDAEADLATEDILLGARHEPPSKPKRKGKLFSRSVQAALLPICLVLVGVGLVSSIQGLRNSRVLAFTQAVVLTKYAVARAGKADYYVRTALGDTAVKSGQYPEVEVGKTVCLQLTGDRGKGGEQRVIGMAPQSLCQR